MIFLRYCVQKDTFRCSVPWPIGPSGVPWRLSCLRHRSLTFHGNGRQRDWRGSIFIRGKLFLNFHSSRLPGDLFGTLS